MTTNAAPTYIQILEISIPQGQKWNANSAHRLIQQLYTLDCREWLSLEILGTSQSFMWFLQAPAKLVNQLENIIYGIYPDATIHTINYLESLSREYHYRYDIQLKEPYVLPLFEVSNFSRTDPLVSFIAALQNIGDGEAATYQIVLKNPTPEVLKLGNKVISKVVDEDRQKYKIAEQKLADTLKECTISVYVKAKSKARADQLAEMIFAPLVIVNQPGLNSLTKSTQQSYYPILTASELASLWHLPNEDMASIQGVLWSPSGNHPLPRELNGFRDGILIGHNSYRGTTEPVHLSEKARARHVNILGKTGLGKSTFMHNLITADIQNGHSVLVIDPHGDLVRDILQSSIPANRQDDVIILDVNDRDHPTGFNMLSVPYRLMENEKSQIASGITGELMKLFGSSLGDRSRLHLRQTVAALINWPNATLLDIPRMSLDQTFRFKVLEKVSNPRILDYWQKTFEARSERDQLEWSQPIEVRIQEFYGDETLFNIFCQPKTLNFRHILDQKQIFLASLGGLPDKEKFTLGALIIEAIKAAGMSRQNLPESKRQPVYFYIDESQKFTDADLESILSEMRKYNVRLTIANQFLSQLQGSTLEAVLGNIGATFSFGLGPNDASKLSKSLQPFTSTELEKLEAFTTATLLKHDGKSLPAFSMRAVKPPTKPPENVAEWAEKQIRTLSKQTYGTPLSEIEEFLSQNSSNPDTLSDNELIDDDEPPAYDERTDNSDE